jgi:hypothetical protein
MTIENYLQETGILATLAGILGGFAFSAVVQLLASEKQDKFTTATIITFSLSSLVSFYAVIAFVLIFAATAEKNAVLTELDNMGTVALMALLGAIFVFLSGVAMAGWIRSKAAGVATTVFAVITMCMVSYLFVRIVSYFM